MITRNQMEGRAEILIPGCLGIPSIPSLTGASQLGVHSADTSPKLTASSILYCSVYRADCNHPLLLLHSQIDHCPFTKLFSKWH